MCTNTRTQVQVHIYPSGDNPSRIPPQVSRRESGFASGSTGDFSIRPRISRWIARWENLFPGFVRFLRDIVAYSRYWRGSRGFPPEVSSSVRLALIRLLDSFLDTACYSFFRAAKQDRRSGTAKSDGKIGRISYLSNVRGNRRFSPISLLSRIPQSDLEFLPASPEDRYNYSRTACDKEENLMSCSSARAQMFPRHVGYGSMGLRHERERSEGMMSLPRETQGGGICNYFLVYVIWRCVSPHRSKRVVLVHPFLRGSICAPDAPRHRGRGGGGGERGSTRGNTRMNPS